MAAEEALRDVEKALSTPNSYATVQSLTPASGSVKVHIVRRVGEKDKTIVLPLPEQR